MWGITSPHNSRTDPDVFKGFISVKCKCTSFASRTNGITRSCCITQQCYGCSGYVTGAYDVSRWHDATAASGRSPATHGSHELTKAHGLTRTYDVTWVDALPRADGTAGSNGFSRADGSDGWSANELITLASAAATTYAAGRVQDGPIPMQLLPASVQHAPSCERSASPDARNDVARATAAAAV